MALVAVLVGFAGSRQSGRNYGKVFQLGSC